MGDDLGERAMARWQAGMGTKVRRIGREDWICQPTLPPGNSNVVTRD